MSNYQGRKTDFTPSVYTRYFEQKESRKSPSGHIYFNEEEEELSKNYQIKRDLIFKRLFPSRYTDSNNENNTENTQIHLNGTNSNTNQLLGDFIPLSSTDNKKQPSPHPDITLSSSDENNNDDDLLIEEKFPTSTHELIVGHVHPRSTIENVRSILIRELYQRTSDPHTEWLKCKMDISKNYINPKYSADFQRRYRKDIQKNKTKKNETITDNNYHVFNTSNIEETTTTTQINNTSENDEIIITSVNKSSTPPEFIVLDSDEEEEEEEDNLDQDANASYYIDRSSNSSKKFSQSASNEDYQIEDSKYAQLPTRNTSSSSSIIRPIISKHQKRKKNTSTKPLVSAIDRIIDHMDETDTINTSKNMEQQNLLIKQIKKRKKKKKKKVIVVNPIVS